MVYVKICLFWFSVYSTNGCQYSGWKEEPKPPPVVISQAQVFIRPNPGDYKQEVGNILAISCHSTYKKKYDLLKLFQYSEDKTSLRLLDRTTKDELDYRLNTSLSDNKTNIFCRIDSSIPIDTRSINIFIINIENDKSDNSETTTDHYHNTTSTTSTSKYLNETDHFNDHNNHPKGLKGLVSSPFKIGLLALGIIVCMISIIGLIYAFTLQRRPNLLEKAEEPEYASAEYIVQYAELNLNPSQSNKPLRNNTPYAEIIGVASKIK